MLRCFAPRAPVALTTLRREKASLKAAVKPKKPEKLEKSGRPKVPKPSKHLPLEKPSILNLMTESGNKAKTFVALLDRVTRPGCGEMVITVSVRDPPPLEHDSGEEEPPRKTHTVRCSRLGGP